MVAVAVVGQQGYVLVVGAGRRGLGVEEVVRGVVVRQGRRGVMGGAAARGKLVGVEHGMGVRAARREERVVRREERAVRREVPGVQMAGPPVRRGNSVLSAPVRGRCT